MAINTPELISESLTSAINQGRKKGHEGQETKTMYKNGLQNKRYNIIKDKIMNHVKI